MGSFSSELDKICIELGDFINADLGRARGVEALDKLFAKYVYACIFAFVSTCFITFVFYFIDNCAPDEVSNCGFIFTPYLPYIDIYNKPWRQIFLLCQCLSSYTGGAIILIIVSQYMFVNEVIILRFDHLASLIKRIPRTKQEDRQALLGRIVRYHNYLLK